MIPQEQTKQSKTAAVQMQVESTTLSEGSDQPNSGAIHVGTVSETTVKPNESTATFAAEVHVYIREQIEMADQKAAFLFVGVATMLAYLHQSGITKLWLSLPSTWSVRHAVSCVTVVALVIGAAAAVLTVCPRLRGTKRGLIFWKSVSEFENSEKYIHDVLQTPDDELVLQRLRHCFELASVCRRKYQTVALAIWSGGIGLFAAILLLAGT